MNAKHTPGPWENFGLNIVGPGGVVIARLVWDQSGEGTGAHEIAPNARLIAAAPELLRVLQEIRDGAAILGDADSIDPTVATALRELVAFAERAIEAATGEGER